MVVNVRCDKIILQNVIVCVCLLDEFESAEFMVPNVNDASLRVRIFS